MQQQAQPAQQYVPAQQPVQQPDRIIAPQAGQQAADDNDVQIGRFDPGFTQQVPGREFPPDWNPDDEKRQ
jgi:hypothetical protein